jgi:hypothetical protein
MSSPGQQAPSSSDRVGLIAMGTCIAFVTAGGILGERLSCGEARFAVVANIFVTASALLTGRLLRRGQRRLDELPMLAVGGGLGIGVVHLAVHLGRAHVPLWLNETAPQLVNDGVAVFSVLLLVWSCAVDLNPAALVVVLLLLTVYRVTGNVWHLDAPPRGFDVRVQTAVVAEVVAAAVALGAYRGTSNVRPSAPL